MSVAIRVTERPDYEAPNPLEKDFGELIGMRQVAAHRGITQLYHKEEWERRGKEHDRLFELVLGALPAEAKHLLFDYETACGEYMAIEVNSVYEQGLKDGAALMDFLRGGNLAQRPSRKGRDA